MPGAEPLSDQDEVEIQAIFKPAANDPRRGFQPVQAEHPPPPDPPPHGAAPDRPHGRLRAEACRRSRKSSARSYQDFLIRVTSFFRDPPAFEVLREHDLPRPDRATGPTISRSASGWPAARPARRSTRVAIALSRRWADAPPATPIKILATDINERRWRSRASGLYIENIAADVSPERLRRFFTRVDNALPDQQDHPRSVHLLAA